MYYKITLMIKKELAETLSEATHSELVQVIGSMIVIYRESKDNKEIELP